MAKSRRKVIKDNAIKVHLPLIRQRNNYTCGVAALQSVLTYFNINIDQQKELMKQLEADRNVGTEPENIIKFAKKQKLIAKEYHKMTLPDVKFHLNKKRPIICLIQAWGKQEQYIGGGSGHYVTAVGYDKEHFYFVDPAMEGIMGYLPHEEFERRWYFSDETEVLHQYGIVIWKPAFHYTHRAAKIE